jgi:hypothetical protein
MKCETNMHSAIINDDLRSDLSRQIFRSWMLTSCIDDNLYLLKCCMCCTLPFVIYYQLFDSNKTNSDRTVRTLWFIFKELVKYWHTTTCKSATKTITSKIQTFTNICNSQWCIMYLSPFPPAISTCWLHKQNSYQSSRKLSWTYQQWAGVITKFSQHLNDNSCENDKSK